MSLLIMNWLRSHVKVYKDEWSYREPFDWKSSLACIIGGLILWPLALKLPVLGYDWYIYFHSRKFIGGYPPWTEQILAPFIAMPWRLGYGLVCSITLVTIAIATAREGRQFSLISKLGAALLALITPPVFMLLWEGNIDGLVLFGLVSLPLGVPLVMLKPTIAGWAVLARKRWFLWSIGFGIFTLIAWRLWPLQMIGIFSTDYLHPMAMGWHNLGWPIGVIGIVMLIFSNADPYRLMAAGSFVAPYIMPYHFLVLLPALGRVSGWKRWLMWGWAWSLFLVPAFEGNTRYIAMGFPLVVWWLLRKQ
jgi:hypothetical protein